MQQQLPRACSASRIDDDIIRDVAEALAHAKRPLIVLGDACRPFSPAVQRAVEELRVPFVTTLRAKGVISEEHRWSLRNFGMAASRWARRYTAGGVDVALVLGTDLDDASVGATPPIGLDGRLIHVDLDPTVFDREWPTWRAIQCDIGGFVERLREASRSFETSDGAAAKIMAEIVRTSPFDRDGAERGSARIAPGRAIRDIEAAAGRGATFVTDVGEHMLFALHYLTAVGPTSFAVLRRGTKARDGSAIDHASRVPGRRVVRISGEGSMEAAGSELAVALELRSPVVYAVFNDARSDSPGDFIEWAWSMGIRVARIERGGQITAEMLDRLTADGRPAVLDIRRHVEVGRDHPRVLRLVPRRLDGARVELTDHRLRRASSYRT